MQNPHVKYLKTKKGFFYLFYYEQGSIFYRFYSIEGWSIPKKIAEKALPVFSLCQDGNMAHLLYSDIDGQLFMASSPDFSRWEHRPMLEGLPKKNGAKYFFLPIDDALHVICHQPTESTGIDALLYTVFRKGKWETPYQIDRFLPMQKLPFLARRLSKEHIILYYRTARNTLSAREMLLEPYTMGSVTPLIQTPAPCTDLSIVNDREKIHLLYIVRGMFRTQVVYQYKHTSAISTPRVLWEDANCDNCMIYLEQNKVVLMWTTNGQAMRCVSENGGTSFGAVEKYTDTFPGKCIKAELLGADNSDFNATECYGDRQNGFLPVIYPLSAIATSIPKTTPHTEDVKPRIVVQENHKQQIAELSALLSQRSDEIAAVNARWKMQTEKLEAELTALRRENEQLKIREE